MEDDIDYKPFFGLLEEPFNTVASPRFFFLSPIHAIALNKSVYTVDSWKGVSVVWGDIGTGKSTLARIMHEKFLNKARVLPIWVAISGRIQEAKGVMRKLTPVPMDATAHAVYSGSHSITM